MQTAISLLMSQQADLSEVHQERIQHRIFAIHTLQVPSLVQTAMQED